MDCTFDWLLIPNARGNLTKYGTYLYYCIKKKFSHTHQFHEKKLSSTLFLGISNDRFCGGQLNSESNEEESIPIYSEVKSQIIWLQFVTGSRDPFVMAELEQRSTTRNRQNSGFFSGSGTEFSRQNRCFVTEQSSNFLSFAADYRNRLNEGFDGTGPGIRLRYSQLRNCLNGHSVIGN